MSKCFLKPDGGNGFYASRLACLRSHYLEQILVKAEASRGGDNGGSEPLVLNVPNVQQDALVKLIEHCERAHRAQNAITDSQTAIEEAEGADQAMVDGLEFELLLRLTGAAHRLGLEPILTIAARRVAGLLLEACATPPGERAGLPMDAYLRPDPSDALSIEDKQAAPLEFVFTRPEWSHEGEYLVAAPPPAIAEPPPPPPKPKTTYGRYPSAGMFGGDEFGGIGLPNGTLTGVHGTAGTGNAGDAGVSQGGQHAESADQLVRLLGGEAPLLSVLQKLDVPSLRNLKANGKRWRNRCRTALCSAAWAEIARGGHSLDLGITRHWLPEERCSACKFLSDGQCSRLSELKADGFVAQLQPLLSREHLDSHALLQSLTVNPTSEASDAAGRGIPDADALAAQSEFCALLAMWVLGSSAVLREADFSALTYSGLLPMRHALAPAVELGTRRNLTWLTVNSSKSALPVRDLVGMPPPPPSHGGSAGAANSASGGGGGGSGPATVIDLKWKRLGALDATLIAQLLKCNRSCTKLDLAWNSELCSAGSTGAIDLAEALAANRTLKELDLSETRLGDSCAPAMCRAVGNATLTKLNLRSTGLGREAREEIEAANRRRATPLALDL